MSSSRVHRPDTILLVITGILLIIGLFMIASASPVMSSSRFGDAYFFLKNQVVGLGIGAAALLISMRIHYTFWKKIAPFLLIISLLLMVLVFVPGIGMTLKGASRWIHIGAITLQPAEILKFAFIAYLASWLVARQKDIKGFASGFIPFLVMLGIISVFFILQPDISTLGVLSISASLLYFSGGGKWSQIGILLLIGILAFGVIVFTQPYRFDRLLVFLKPNHDLQGIGYQLHQGLIALGSGGFWGKGFGMSRQKFNYLPEATGDSIFAIFGEEFGFFGIVILIGLFLIFFWRGIRIAHQAPDAFGRYLATGLTLLIIIQAFINMAAISGLVPLTGLPLSFISFGSSALVMNLAEVGILMNISKYTRT